MKKIVGLYLDDILFVLGCLFILRGLSLWSNIVTWIAAGVMLIVFGVMIAKDMAHVVEKHGNEQQSED